jgi:phytoene/squalene synthetase
MQLFDKTALQMSKKLALNYSTSFSAGIRLLSRECGDAVFAIYGFVRVADEIVDTFYQADQVKMLQEFRNHTYDAIQNKISTNPVLHALQLAANKYAIGPNEIDPFFESMSEDLDVNTHNEKSYKQYIYGSAEVVGLMCLKVFCNGDDKMYASLKPHARSLGAAFQKVNFLRDMKSDFVERGRVYFPSMSFDNFSELQKLEIIKDIKKDFSHAYEGIIQLPVGCRLGVYTAYIYYLKLLEKIEKTTVKEILQARIRISNGQKLFLVVKSMVNEKLKLFQLRKITVETPR